MSRRRKEVDSKGWNQARGTRRRGSQPKSRAPRHSLGQRIAGYTSVVLTAVLVAGALVAYAKYRAFWDSIRRVDVAAVVGPQPPKLNNSENILLIGSDTRIGQDGVGGSAASVQGGRSDTLMLRHISPSHHTATVISIPRETMVPVIACAANDGTAGQTAEPGQEELINAALDFGGPACTWKTFEYVTDIHVDHFVMLDFTGFEKIIDDLGGVEVCLPQPVDDPMSGLDLRKGRHHIYGSQALAFWRTREDLGTGSDLQRIQRDQFLMASLVQGLEHSDLLASPSKVLDVIRDATDAMTTDTGLDQDAMLATADAMKSVKSSSVQFVTAPNMPDPDNDNNVVFQQPQAQELFNAIAHDTAPQSAKKGKSGTGTPATPVVETTSPSNVNVQVENGSGITGVAGQAGSDLTNLGFNVVGTGDADNFGFSESMIEYAAASDLPAVNTLKAHLSNVQVTQDSTLTPGTVVLILGSSFNGLSSQSTTPPSTSSPSSSPSVASVSAADGGLSGDSNICSDQAAFAGPDS
jgi:LCP family protein required for cell wall assembly